jgi:transposase
MKKLIGTQKIRQSSVLDHVKNSRIKLVFLSSYSPELNLIVDCSLNNSASRQLLDYLYYGDYLMAVRCN